MKRKPFIVLIFGASGSGKTTLFKELVRHNPNFSIHAKGTDRKPKKYDSNEIICKTKITFAEYDYIYHQYGHKYGIQKAQLEKALKDNRDHFIICNDIDTIKTIKNEYGDRVKTIFLLFNAPQSQIKAVQKERGITDDDIELRMSKITVLSELFLDNSDLFDGVILNKVGAPTNTLVKQLYQILNIEDEYISEEIQIGATKLSNIAEIVNIIYNNLKEYTKSGIAPIQQGYVFILMAIVGNSKTDDTLNAIKRATKNCGLTADRVDDIAFTDRITDKVLGSIRCAEYIVADISRSRPNVYYEIGYAHAFKKTTILTAKKSTKPHFDIQDYKIIYYDSNSELESELISFFEKHGCIGD